MAVSRDTNGSRRPHHGTGLRHVSELLQRRSSSTAVSARGGLADRVRSTARRFGSRPTSPLSQTTGSLAAPLRGIDSTR